MMSRKERIARKKVSKLGVSLSGVESLVKDGSVWFKMEKHHMRYLMGLPNAVRKQLDDAGIKTTDIYESNSIFPDWTLLEVPLTEHDLRLRWWERIFKCK